MHYMDGCGYLLCGYLRGYGKVCTLILWRGEHPQKTRKFALLENFLLYGTGIRNVDLKKTFPINTQCEGRDNAKSAIHRQLNK